MIEDLSYKHIYMSLWNEYKNSFEADDVDAAMKRIQGKKTEITKNSFDFYTSIASVFSSRIEGENIELDSYVKHKILGVTYQADYTKKPDDLFDAYLFARDNSLSPQNLLYVHKLISRHLLTGDKQGIVRTQQMFVLAKDGNIDYVAADAGIVKEEFERLMLDLIKITQAKLSLGEVFFFASVLHLLFVKIHPMYDGNGRTARLLEKWFIAQHLGIQAWNIECERYYYENIGLYYGSLRRLGHEYDSLDYSKALPFTQLLIKSLAL